MSLPLPLSAFHIMPSDPALVVKTKLGESGYYEVRRLPDKVSALIYRDELNRLWHISEADRLAHEAGSMFGWDVPGADPNHALNAKLAASVAKKG